MANLEVWSDLDHRLISDVRTGIKKVVNVDSVFTSIHNILGTFQGERVMLPEFASKTRGVVFDPIDATLLHFVSTDIKKTIERWDDRVDVQEVSYIFDPDGNYVEFTVNFRIRGYDEVLSYKFNSVGV